jgi:hypothetical protein
MWSLVAPRSLPLLLDALPSRLLSWLAGSRLPCPGASMSSCDDGIAACAVPEKWCLVR